MKKLRKTQIQWLNHEIDELILFANEMAGPAAVKHAVKRIEKVISNQSFKACERRYYRNLNQQ